MSRVSPRDLLVGVATFLVVLAVLLHVLVTAGFAQTVPSERTTTRSVATGATVLAPGADEPVTGVTLVRTRTVDPTNPPVPDVDAYVVSTSTRLLDGTFVGRDRWTAVQERVSGRVVASPANTEQVTTFDVNGSTVEERRALRGMGGLLLRFPRDTPATDQVRWDPITRSVGDVVLVGEERLAGARVLEMRQGSESEADGVRTVVETLLSVRPETGAVVRQDVSIQQRRDDGTTLLDARFVDDPEQVAAASARVDAAVTRHTWSATVVPAMILFLGIVALVVAVLEGGSGRLTGRWRAARPQEVR